MIHESFLSEKSCEQNVVDIEKTRREISSRLFRLEVIRDLALLLIFFCAAAVFVSVIASSFLSVIFSTVLLVASISVSIVMIKYAPDFIVDFAKEYPKQQEVSGDVQRKYPEQPSRLIDLREKLPEYSLESRMEREAGTKDSFVCPYIKKQVWEALSPEERNVIIRPSSVMEEILYIRAYWPSGFKEEHEKSSGVAPSFRCERELLFVLLGFFSVEELLDLRAFCKEFQSKNTSVINEETSSKCYAECIKKYPQLVAAEAAYLSWLKESYSYLGDVKSSIFRSSSWYRSAFINRLIFGSSIFEGMEKIRKVATVLAKLSGWGPACLASLKIEKEALDTLKAFLEKNKESDNWEFFQSKVSEFNAHAVFHKNALGDLGCFAEFVEKGKQSSCFQGEATEFTFEKSDKNFFSSPGGLWEMHAFCEQDAELAAKIEEGLSSLSQAGYVGAQTIEELQNFERIVLGLTSSSPE
ncbi:hypothetical protein [Chlamydiifrater phoenicopteri]|uniref:hypothetical protein n=1 Tax=Chlamydiifrater phoenicopteri TaxID=2681469 RepID=UPI001BCCA346|nr:hypothetical protein [Chlamydiifrater phoenicopteri]